MSDTRAKLMDAAELSIRKMGYNSVSFRDLAAALDIKSASVHYHFPKKEDLGLALVDRYSENFFKALNTRAKNAASPLEKVEAFIDTYGDALETSDAVCLCGVLGAEIGSLPAPLSKNVNAFFDANMDWLKSVFPSDWTDYSKDTKAGHILAALQGSMMLANALKSKEFFDQTGAQILSSTFERQVSNTG